MDNTDAEKRTGQQCFVCVCVKITNNIYTVHFEISLIFCFIHLSDPKKKRENLIFIDTLEAPDEQLTVLPNGIIQSVNKRKELEQKLWQANVKFC